MKAVLVILIDLIVAIPTGCGGIRIGRILHHTLVGSLPIGVIGIATMTLMACYLPVVLIVQDLTVNKDLLVWGQRLRSAASPLTFYLFRFGRRSGFSDLPGDLY